MDLGSKGKTPRVGARLKALDEAVLMAVSDFSCNYFLYPRPSDLNNVSNYPYYLLHLEFVTIFCGLQDTHR